MKEVIDEWRTGVYKALARVDLVEKWKARFKEMP